MNKVTTPINRNSPLYSMRYNLGTQSEPFYSYAELGEFSSDIEAEKEMIKRLKTCPAILCWEMLKVERLSNTQKSVHQEDTICTHMSGLSQIGLTLNVSISGNDEGALINALFAVAEEVSSGSSSGCNDYFSESSSFYDYQFETFGK